MKECGIRSPKLKAAEAVESSLCDLLHQRAFDEMHSGATNAPKRNTTSAIYLWASQKHPDLLEHIFTVHLSASRERREIPRNCTRLPDSAIEKQRMLSAVRATVARSRRRSHR